ncbi:Uncharacterized protein FWK35_00019454 [Aphis craccivora]|uniref:Uncharacterized protein n=1 Tax=Aphis craccivora TaxID=307492 RepID=A0A6G0ZEE1_APHCR|nr:Uncharacterized protein FWK35_00019454 [Aphis craccivora]
MTTFSKCVLKVVSVSTAHLFTRYLIIILFLVSLRVQRQRHSHYSPLLSLTNLDTFGTERIRFDLYFTFKLLNGIINCSKLQVKFNLLVSGSCTRQSNIFYVPFHLTNYAQNTIVTRLIVLVNKYNVNLFFCYISFNVYLNNFVFNSAGVLLNEFQISLWHHVIGVETYADKIYLCALLVMVLL